MFEYLLKHAHENPDHPALISEVVRLSYKELYETIVFNQKQLSIERNQVVILRLENQAEFVISLFVLLSMGLWVVPVPPKITERELEVIESFIGAFITIDREHNPVSFHNRDGEGVLIRPDENNAGIYHMTSGSTGVPKFCVRSVKNLTCEGESYTRTLHLGSGDKILNLPPLYHSYALGASCFSGVVSGAAICTMDRFIPRKILKTIDKERPTILILVPFMAKMLAATYQTETRQFSSLRIVLAGSGKIDKQTYQLFQERFGMPLLCNYGSTETGGLISRLEPEPYDAIGKPMAGVICKIIEEDGTTAKAGKAGEIWVKTPAMAAAYLNSIPFTLDADGFYNMGDIGAADELGNIYIKNRKKLVINIAGKKVNPVEVEEILMQYPGIWDCVVFGITRANGNEAVKAVIAAGNDVKENRIREYCHMKLSEFKVPSEIEICTEIPRDELGKVRYGFLKEKNDDK